MELVPVRGDGSVIALAVTDGKLIGITRPSGTLFTMSGPEGEVEEVEVLPGRVPDLCLSPHGGSIYGITGSEVFRLDPQTCQRETVGTYLGEITAGFAVNESGVYFASGTHLIRCLLP
jgi:hypothetical protein